MAGRADGGQVNGGPLTLVPESGRDARDPRVAAVLEVLAGRPAPEVSRAAGVDVAVLHRWVHAFVDAGTATVTNRPDPDAARQRDRFLAAFAHELRTPLAVAQGWVAMLADEELPGGLDRTVGRLEDALTRLASRTFDVELLAAASLGLLRTTTRPLPVADLVESLGEVAATGLDAVVMADPELFPRVLRDLWEAGHALPAPRSVRLEAVRVDPWVELRVVRDADPIDPAVLQALFEPFDLNDDATGVTIGLYLARALTVAHGGTLGVDQDDAGATLWVRIPAAPTLPVPDLAPAENTTQITTQVPTPMMENDR